MEYAYTSVQMEIVVLSNFRKGGFSAQILLRKSLRLVPQLGIVTSRTDGLPFTRGHFTAPGDGAFLGCGTSDRLLKFWQGTRVVSFRHNTRRTPFLAVNHRTSHNHQALMLSPWGVSLQSLHIPG